MTYVLFRYLHFLAIIGLAGALLITNMAISRTISGEDAHNLAKVDGVYGLSAIAVLVFGLVLWLGVGKPADFYSHNPVFHAKVGFFILLGLLSIYPTVFFLKHRKTEATELTVPRLIIWLLRLEIVVLVIIPILAALMARGIGLES